MTRIMIDDECIHHGFRLREPVTWPRLTSADRRGDYNPVYPTLSQGH